MPELPVGYIAAVIFLAIVVVLIGYMFFTKTGIFQSVGKRGYCEALKLDYCRKLLANQEVSWDPSCSGIDIKEPSKEECEKIIPEVKIS